MGLQQAKRDLVSENGLGVAIPKNCEKKPLKLRKLTPKIFSLF